jgi:hypothetical protein
LVPPAAREARGAPGAARRVVFPGAAAAPGLVPALVPPAAAVAAVAAAAVAPAAVAPVAAGPVDDEQLWRGLFDTNNTRFTIQGVYNPRPFQDLWSSHEQHAHKENAHNILKAYHIFDGPVQSFRSICMSVYPIYPPNRMECLTAFLASACRWNARFTHGYLMCWIFVALTSLKQHTVRRSALSYEESRVQQNSDWQTLCRNFLNKSVSFLIHSILHGPTFTPATSRRVKDYNKVHEPHYMFMVLPILKMARGFFPEEFDLEVVLNAEPKKFVKQYRGRIGGGGVYSLPFVKAALEDGDTPFDNAMIQGGYYSYYRVLALASHAFDLRNCSVTTIPHNPNRFYCGGQEIRQITLGIGISITPPWSQQPFSYYAQRLYEFANGAYQAPAGARVEIQQEDMDMDEHEHPN